MHTHSQIIFFAMFSSLGALWERQLAAVGGSGRVAIPGVVEARKTLYSTTDHGGLRVGNLPQAIGASQKNMEDIY